MTLLAPQFELLERAELVQVTGRVTAVTGLTVLAEHLPVSVGSMCEIVPRHGAPIAAQAVGFQDSRTVLMPLSEVIGVSTGDRVRSSASLQHVPVGRQMIGRVLDGLGRPIDERGAFAVEAHYPVIASAPAALSRTSIDEPMATGVRSIDAMHTLGKGQRLGVFAGTGVGKSVLMGMIARNTAADVNVVALVGERGREVGDFLKRDLGDEGLKRTIMVVSTSDRSPVERVRACFVATAIAEYFRDEGADVLLMMDSTTRMAMAQRQIGLAAGEPPATKGYTPSVFALIPQLLERAGRTAAGSITGLYTVLVEGDDINEPVADAVRGTLDGHIWLSRKLANRGHFPAVATLDSISRVMPDIVGDEDMAAARTVRSVLATWEDIEDLVNIGAYAAGSNVEYDIAVQGKPWIDEFLRQGMRETSTAEETRTRLRELVQRIDGLRAKLGGCAAKAPQAKRK
ncbi:MAG: FliI/YscN family ATPase [Phycisphaerales bacterium]|nr:FliI/YscN family ATPase [Phycisphaerales bacterium]